jgi:hypothetical protein
MLLDAVSVDFPGNIEGRRSLCPTKELQLSSRRKRFRGRKGGRGELGRSVDVQSRTSTVDGRACECSRSTNRLTKVQGFVGRVHVAHRYRACTGPGNFARNVKQRSAGNTAIFFERILQPSVRKSAFVLDRASKVRSTAELGVHRIGLPGHNRRVDHIQACHVWRRCKCIREMHAIRTV